MPGLNDTSTAEAARRRYLVVDAAIFADVRQGIAHREAAMPVTWMNKSAAQIQYPVRVPRAHLYPPDRA